MTRQLPLSVVFNFGPYMGEEKDNNSYLGSYFICVLYVNHVGINTVDPKMKDLVAKLFLVIKSTLC